MGRLDAAAIREEWRRSRATLAELLGSAPVLASVPGGYLSPSVVSEAATAGYFGLFTSEPVSRERISGGMSVLGRYAIWASTPATTAAAYARGDRRACARLRAEWTVKRLLKTVAPRPYETARRARARFPAR
jgi:hypothetical protein